jgi:hypothetical protein
MDQRANPIPTDKDAEIDMEPLTPSGIQPVSFSVGRVFHEDRAVVPLLLARQELLTRPVEQPPRAVVVSNAGGGLPLLETFSRNTVHEFENAGYRMTALIGDAVKEEDVRQRLPEADIFLWEGHHNTLIREWGFAAWDEPLPPALIFLQSCLALKEYKVQPLLSRGAVGVIGSSTRTYSASGGACSLAFFNAMLYGDQTVGGSLRQAKNFLLAYALLKEKRLGKEATRTGANLRAAWAFTLWGDPTVKLPVPARPDDAHRPIRHEVTGNTIVLQLPDSRLDTVTTQRGTSTPAYQVRMPANARLAGLVHKGKADEAAELMHFVFAEVYLPKARPGQTPTLRSRLPAANWVFCWDGRRRTGYLLAIPHGQDGSALRFHIDWTPEPGPYTVAEEKAP